MVSVSPRNEQTLPAYNSSPKQSVSRHVRNRNPPNRYRSEDVSQMFQIKQTHALEMYPRLITVSSEILCCCLFRRLGLEVFCSRNNATASSAYLLLVSKNHNKHFFTIRKRFSFPPTALLWLTSTQRVSCAKEKFQSKNEIECHLHRFRGCMRVDTGCYFELRRVFCYKPFATDCWSEPGPGHPLSALSIGVLFVAK